MNTKTTTPKKKLSPGLYLLICLYGLELFTCMIISGHPWWEMTCRRQLSSLTQEYEGTESTKSQKNGIVGAVCGVGIWVVLEETGLTCTNQEVSL